MYHPKAQDIPERGGLVDVLAHDVVGGVDGDIVLGAGGALAARLLVDDPDAGAGAGGHLGGLLGDEELQARHGAQAVLEGLARLDDVEHVDVVHGLARQHGVVGRRVEERRLGEVHQYRVRVEAPHHGNRLRTTPLDLVEGLLVLATAAAATSWRGHLLVGVYLSRIPLFVSLRIWVSLSGVDRM